MAKKTNTPDLPNMGGPGIAPLSIPEVDKAINAYERKKEKRCEASPGEISAKRDLKDILVANAEKLPVNDDGNRFYRKDGVDYIITSILKRRGADEEEGSRSSTEL